MAKRDQVQIAVYPLSANPIDYSAHTTAKPPAIGKDTVAVSYRRMYIAAFPLRECGFFVVYGANSRAAASEVSGMFNDIMISII